MERLHRTVVQLEEAKRFIQCGDIAHLRLALILLDNAVEVMMHHVIEDALRHSEAYERMLQTFPDGPLDAQGEELRRSIASNVVPAKQQKQIRRYFGKKVAFLSEDHTFIPRPSARALRHLHTYRNETQHSDHVRPESISPAVLVLFDIATDLLARLTPGATSWTSETDFSWLRNYRMRNPFDKAGDMRGRIAAQLRLGLPLDDTEIRTALAAHLTDRLDAMENGLGFISGGLTIGPDEARVLKALQVQHAHPGLDPAAQNSQLQTFAAPYDHDSFKRWRGAIEKLNVTDNKLQMFDRFATIEDEFEPLEGMIDDAVSAIDAQIQMEIDLARGK
jgi:hypothetical protein